MQLLRVEQSPIAAYLADRMMQEMFLIVDVGCSGGLDTAWRAFGDRLAAVGIDPNRSEIVRLAGAEKNPFVRYFAAFAGIADDHPLHRFRVQAGLKSSIRRSFWDNLSVAAIMARRAGMVPKVPADVQDVRSAEMVEAALIEEVDFETVQRQPLRHHFAAWEGANLVLEQQEADEIERQAKLTHENLWHDADLVGPECTLDVSDLLDYLAVDSADFIKIDVDGSDYDLLHSLEKKLGDLNVLGAALEVNFVGSGLPHHHTFHNTDRLMRNAGFGLFGLTVRNYSSASLPAPFLLNFPAQTTLGRPLQGDALYLRDFAFITENSDSSHFSWEKLAKLIALFAMFDLPDMAAETALRFRDRLESWIDVEVVLDMLAAQIQEKRGSVSRYKDYMAEFAAEDPWFFDAQHRSK